MLNYLPVKSTLNKFHFQFHCRSTPTLPLWRELPVARLNLTFCMSSSRWTDIHLGCGKQLSFHRLDFIIESFESLTLRMICGHGLLYSYTIVSQPESGRLSHEILCLWIMRARTRSDNELWTLIKLTVSHIWLTSEPVVFQSTSFWDGRPCLQGCTTLSYFDSFRIFSPGEAIWDLGKLFFGSRQLKVAKMDGRAGAKKNVKP